MTRSVALCLLILARVTVAQGAEATNCTRELSASEFAGTVPLQMTCGTVAVTLEPIESEMYYHRWLVKLSVRSARGGDEARINLAAFDAAGALIGAHGLVARDIATRTRSFAFRMEGMYLSTANTVKILLSLNVAGRKEP